MSQVWDLDLPTSDKFVLMRFADFADDDGRNSYPSYERVAIWCGVSLRTVNRIVTRMKDAGVLVPERNRGGGRGLTVNYRIDLAKARETFGEVEMPDPKRAMKKSATTSQFGGAGKGDTESSFEKERVPRIGEKYDSNRAKVCHLESYDSSDPCISGARESASDLSARWRDALPAVVDQFGAGARTSITDLLPIRDTGDEVVFLARTVRDRDHAQRIFAPIMSRVLKQPVLMVCRGSGASPDYQGREALNAEIAKGAPSLEPIPTVSDLQEPGNEFEFHDGKGGTSA